MRPSPDPSLSPQRGFLRYTCTCNQLPRKPMIVATDVGVIVPSLIYFQIHLCFRSLYFPLRTCCCNHPYQDNRVDSGMHAYPERLSHAQGTHARHLPTHVGQLNQRCCICILLTFVSVSGASSHEFHQKSVLSATSLQSRISSLSFFVFPSNVAQQSGPNTILVTLSFSCPPSPSPTTYSTILSAAFPGSPF